MEKRALALAAVLAAGVMGGSARADLGTSEIGKTFVVEPPISDHVRTLSQRERREQIRDWAVLGTVAQIAGGAEQAAAATYELPPMRLPFLEELYSFEYGRGRRAYVGDRVLLFRDSDDPDPQVTIGRLADRVRMENGDGFTRVEVYVVEDDRNAGEIKVQRQADIAYVTLFSAAYGYVEGDAADEKQLASWLTRADDLTYVKVQYSGHVTIGGRRFAHSQTPNLTVEDVAAIYQAFELSGGHPGFSLDPVWLPSATDASRPMLVDALRSLAADPCADLREISARAPKVLAQEPDPTRRTLRGMRAQNTEILGEHLTQGCEQLKSTAPALERIAQTLAREWFAGGKLDVEPLHALGRRLAQAMPGQAAAHAIEVHLGDAQVQCARYDGFAGTRVGMTLFYTDLIAKLWGITDYGLSAPTLAVPGFLTGPELDLPTAFQNEQQTEGRLWFGSRDAAVSKSVGEHDAVLLFAHQFSRVFGASNSPLGGGAEVRPFETARRVIGWWDRHYDEIADYEPQYHVQNQIMKWSLLAAGTASHPRLAYLRSFAVDRSLRFTDWQRDHAASLRFAEGLPAPHERVPGRECLPVIASYSHSSAGSIHQLAGGVSLADGGALRAAPTVLRAKPLGQRLAGVPGASADAVGSAARAVPVRAGKSVRFGGASDVPTVGRQGPMKLGDVRIEYESAATGRTISIKASADAGPLGELKITRGSGTSTTARLDWEAGSVAESGRVMRVTNLSEADAAARAGRFDLAARGYERLPQTLEHEVIVNLAKERPAAALANLEKLTENGVRLPTAAKANIVNAFKKYGGPEVAKLAERRLGRLPAGDAQLIVRDGRIVTTRNLGATSVETPARASVRLDPERLYIADDVRVAQDGFLADTGRLTARWRKIPNTKIEELTLRDGELADVLVKNKVTFERVPAGLRPEPRAPQFDWWHPPMLQQRRVQLISRCDGEHKTPDKSDDCPDQAR